jgi:hypothetical protein
LSGAEHESMFAEAAACNAEWVAPDTDLVAAAQKLAETEGRKPDAETRPSRPVRRAARLTQRGRVKLSPLGGFF